eukprot:SAG31_NODE_8408_length_1457_cov_1.553756_2_plen_162_part_00
MERSSFTEPNQQSEWDLHSANLERIWLQCWSVSVSNRSSGLQLSCTYCLAFVQAMVAGAAHAVIRRANNLASARTLGKRLAAYGRAAILMSISQRKSWLTSVLSSALISRLSLQQVHPTEACCCIQSPRRFQEHLQQLHPFTGFPFWAGTTHAPELGILPY